MITIKYYDNNIYVRSAGFYDGEIAPFSYIVDYFEDMSIVMYKREHIVQIAEFKNFDDAIEYIVMKLEFDVNF